MCTRFLKFIPSEEAFFLMNFHPNAFVVLAFIAAHARRISGLPDGLIIGDALVSSESFRPGLSRQNFRTALEKLAELKHIKIVSNGKKFFEREKSTIKITIKSHLVNICDTRIYDINSNDGNQQNNQQLTNSQPTANHKQEGIRMNKKEDYYYDESAESGESQTPAAGNNNFPDKKTEKIAEKEVYACLQGMEFTEHQKKQITSKYPEELVSVSLSFLNHPEGPTHLADPIEKLKYLKHMLNHPEEFKQSIASMGKPKQTKALKEEHERQIKAKESLDIKQENEKYIEHFEKRKRYNGWIFIKDENLAGFESESKPKITRIIALHEIDFKDRFKGILKELKIDKSATQDLANYS